jgi:hypothetical protein
MALDSPDWEHSGICIYSSWVIPSLPLQHVVEVASYMNHITYRTKMAMRSQIIRAPGKVFGLENVFQRPVGQIPLSFFSVHGTVKKRVYFGGLSESAVHM